MNKLKCQPLIFQFYSLFILDEPNPIEPLLAYFNTTTIEFFVNLFNLIQLAKINHRNQRKT